MKVQIFMIIAMVSFLFIVGFNDIEKMMMESNMSVLFIIALFCLVFVGALSSMLPWGK